MTERPVALVLGASADDPPPGIDAASTFAELRFAPDGSSLTATLPGTDAVFAYGSFRDELETAWRLADAVRWIHSASDGVDGLLFPALIASDVIVTNARGVFDEPIAEWVIAAICASATGFTVSVRDTVAGRWGDDRRRDRVTGARLLIVGPGPIGRAVVPRARALGIEIEAVGRRARADEVFERVLGHEDLHAALGRADHVLDALPGAPGTRGVFDEAAFAAMRPTAWFYNVGRGSTVDEGALVRALRDGSIAGAALDVFAEEPLPADSPLWALPNVVISPHVCGDFDGWEAATVGVFVDNLGRFVRGEPLRNPVDKAAGFGAEPA